MHQLNISYTPEMSATLIVQAWILHVSSTVFVFLKRRASPYDVPLLKYSVWLIKPGTRRRSP